MDTTGAGEGNLEVIIKDGYDTLKAQLLKREKRKFEIGFTCERNMKHEIQVIFNGIQIRDSPFYLLPDSASNLSKSNEDLATTAENTSAGSLTGDSGALIGHHSGLCGNDSAGGNSMLDEYTVIEGGPLEGVQCGEKFWIILDSQSIPYADSQFLVIDDTNSAIKHTKIQLEDGRWRIEFIPTSPGPHKIQRLIRCEPAEGASGERIQAQHIFKVDVLNYSTQRVVYGYKLYSIQDSVQLVFDAANFRVQDIWPEIKDPNDEVVDDLDCKYLSDYLALKFAPELVGGYLVNFYDRNDIQHLAQSPYKIIIHESLREIVRSCGIYDLTRITLIADEIPRGCTLDQIRVDILGTYILNSDSFTSSNQMLKFQIRSRDTFKALISRIDKRT